MDLAADRWEWQIGKRMDLAADRWQWQIGKRMDSEMKQWMPRMDVEAKVKRVLNGLKGKLGKITYFQYIALSAI